MKFDNGQDCDNVFVHSSDMPPTAVAGDLMEFMVSYHLDKTKTVPPAY